jgi:uncharacterized protein (TIGR02722 family)
MNNLPVVFKTAVLAAMLLASGCSAFRQSVSNEDPRSASTLTAKFDQRDLLEMAEQLASDILAHPFPPAGSTAPIVASLGINNNTRTHLDVVSLEDTLTTHLLNSGRMQFVNTARRDDLLKEQGYQLANATEASRVQIGKQLGARYMLTGSITEIGTRTGKQVRASKQEDVYYQLTLELTDLETGLIVMRKQRDRLRRKSSPVFGW